MRKEREFFKPKNDGVYLHLYNRTVTLGQLSFPFSDNEKKMLRFITEKFLLKYNIELLSFVIMSNHFHMLVYCPSNKMSKEDACASYNNFHKDKFVKPIPIEDSRISSLVENSNNISEFMREVQGEFSKWFNKSRPYKRKGSLWEDRFKSQLIESDVYLWGCMKYLEMNPVRAGITNTPENYKFSSYGQWHENKKHPYQENFLKHIVNLANSDVSIDELKTLMALEMKQMKMHDDLKRISDKKEYQRALVANEELLEAIKLISTQINAQVLVFSKKDFMAGHTIGSKSFMREKYRQWVSFKNSA